MKNIIAEWNKTGKSMQDALKIIGASATAKYTNALKNASIAGYEITPEMVVACYIRKVEEKASSPAGAVLYALQRPADCYDAMVKQHADVFLDQRPETVKTQEDDLQRLRWKIEHLEQRLQDMEISWHTAAQNEQEVELQLQRERDKLEQVIEALKYLHGECQNIHDRSNDFNRAMFFAQNAIDTNGGWVKW